MEHCINDQDNDSVCDEIDDCVGEYDECNVCNGSRPEKMVMIAMGNCINDQDGDGVCDEDEELGCQDGEAL